VKDEPQKKEHIDHQNSSSDEEVEESKAEIEPENLDLDEEIPDYQYQNYEVIK